MVRPFHARALLAGALLSFGALPAVAESVSYDFSGASGSSTPVTIGLATFSSPSDPGAFTFGPNAGLYTDLGSVVLSSAGTVAELDITFSVPQAGISFDFPLGDFLALGGGDILNAAVDGGTPQQVTAALVGSDFFPEGTFSLTSASSFSSIELTSQYPITIADLTTVPEPASIAVLGAAAACLGGLRRRRR